MHTVRPLAYVLAVGFLCLQTAGATQIPRLSFEQLTDTSDVIASGRITNSWTAWDSDHKYIWTHYNLAVASTVKGTAGSVVEFAEPGGAVGGTTMSIAGAVSYAAGENMVVFLSRMPNGYLRTTGWAQGKYSLDSAGKLHGHAAIDAEIIHAGNSGTGTSLTTLDGITLAELSQRIAARVRQMQEKTK